MYTELRADGLVARNALANFDIVLGRSGLAGIASLETAAELPGFPPDGAACEVWLGFDEAHLWKVMTGYLSSSGGTAVVLGDALWLAGGQTIQQAFVNVQPQEVIQFALRQAALPAIIDTAVYRVRERHVVSKATVPDVILGVDRAWGLTHDLYADRDGRVVWQLPRPAETVYEFSYGSNILECEYTDGRGRLLTILAPYVDHWGQVDVIHPEVVQRRQWVTGLRHYTVQTGARTEIFLQEAI